MPHAYTTYSVTLRDALLPNVHLCHCHSRRCTIVAFCDVSCFEAIPGLSVVCQTQSELRAQPADKTLRDKVQIGAVSRRPVQRNETILSFIFRLSMFVFYSIFSPAMTMETFEASIKWERFTFQATTAALKMGQWPLSCRCVSSRQFWKQRNIGK